MGSGGKVYSIADAQEFVRRGLATQTAVDALTGTKKLDEFVAKTPSLRAAKQPNKTEQEFGRILQARIDKGELRGPLKFEAVKLRIGGNCYYTPDWMCFIAFGREGQWWPIFFEVKGAHIWDDSKVKFKAAVEQHSWAFFDMWQKKGGEWRRIH